MKKFFALLLTLVICLSVTMTAFAGSADDHADHGDDISVADPATDFADNEAKTNVDVLVCTSNISATVPLDVAIVAHVNGGDCICPDGYKITNTSLIPIKVTNVKAVDKADNLALAASVAATDIDKYTVTFKPTGFDAINLANANGADLGAAAWSIAAATDLENGTDLAIGIEAENSALDFTNDQMDAVTVTYTIAAQ